MAPTRVILQEVSGPLFGNLNPNSDAELTEVSIGGGFGRQVAIQTQGVTSENTDDNDDATITVIASYAEPQKYQGDRRRRQNISENYQLAIFECDATLGCDSGTSVDAGQISASDFDFALPSHGLGGKECFLTLWKEDWVYLHLRKFIM